jgi:hypothetical protein
LFAFLFACLAVADGVRCDRDADGGEHGLQGEQHDIRLCRLQFVIEEGDGHLGDGGGDLLRRQGRGQVEHGCGLLVFCEDAGAIGRNSETPEQDFGERGFGDGFGDFFVVVVVVRLESRI